LTNSEEAFLGSSFCLPFAWEPGTA